MNEELTEEGSDIAKSSVTSIQHKLKQEIWFDNGFAKIVNSTEKLKELIGMVIFLDKLIDIRQF